MPEFVNIDPVERNRVYIFPNDEVVALENVTKVAVSSSGYHRVETEAGEKYIVAPGWLAIDINVDEWSF